MSAERLGVALRLDVEIGEPRSLARQPVDARCRCTTQHAAAVDADLAVAKVVHQDEDDVRLPD
jgi:hypothetical protein